MLLCLHRKSSFPSHTSIRSCVTYLYLVLIAGIPSPLTTTVLLYDFNRDIFFALPGRRLMEQMHRSMCTDNLHAQLDSTIAGSRQELDSTIVGLRKTLEEEVSFGFGLVWFGLVCLVWFGFGVVWCGVWFGLVWFGFAVFDFGVVFGLVWFGFGVIWFGLVLVWFWCGVWLCLAVGAPPSNAFFRAATYIIPQFYRPNGVIAACSITGMEARHEKQS